jgi:diketogulonate reductase-like aldo/keto reductase
MKGSTLTLNNGVEMPAFAYMNEEQVAEGLRQRGVERSEVFITTKLWISDYGYDQALHGFDRSMRKLGIDQLDLWLLHQPVPTDWEKTLASWKAAERLLGEGRVRAIGVSNASPKHFEDLIARSETVPVDNQVELHPFFTQQPLRDAHARLGFVT